LCKWSIGKSKAENLWSEATKPNFTSVGVNAGNTPVTACLFFVSAWTQQHAAPELQKRSVCTGSRTATQVLLLMKHFLVLTVATKLLNNEEGTGASWGLEELQAVGLFVTQVP